MGDKYTEKLLATLVRFMIEQNAYEVVEVLRVSSASLRDTGYRQSQLVIEVPSSTYFQIRDTIDVIKLQIVSVIDEIVGPEFSIESVVIKPKLEAPDNWREELYRFEASQFGLPKPNSQYEADIFMLMPFKEGILDVVYRDHICEVVNDLGLTIKRGDDFFTTHAIMADIWSATNAAEIIIADCTERNPNVFYELGISHTLGKKTVMITQSADDIPFDLRQWRYIEYKTSSQGLKKLRVDLEKAIKLLLDDEEDSSVGSSSSQESESTNDEIPF